MKKERRSQADCFLAVIEGMVTKILEEKLQNYVKFLVAQVVNIDTYNGRARVKYLEIDKHGNTNSNFLDVAVKTEELIKKDDTVLVLYVKNLSNAFISGKMTSTYYSRNEK